MQAQHKLWIKNGFRASLKTGNLLTGSLFIEFQHHPELADDSARPVELEKFAGYDIIPSVPDEFSQLTAKASRFVDGLNELPLTEVSGKANALLTEFTETAKAFQQLSHNLNTVIQDVDRQQLSAQLRQTLQSYEALSKDLSSGSKGYEDLRKTLAAMTKVMHELQPLLNQLNHQPNGLIFNPGSADRIEPKKYSGDQP